jgi:group I intron endonuclease
MCFGIIYKVTNIVNGKIYIGQTTQGLVVRETKHFSGKVKHYFSRALHKYGRDNFTWETIEYCDSKEELDEMEFHYIKQYNSNNREYGYNCTLGGEGQVGFKHTKESIEKMRIAQLGNKNMLGKHHTDITKKILSEKASGSNHNRYGKYGKENPAAKKFVITTPKGTEFVVVGLRYYCDDIMNNVLKLSNMSACARGLRLHHKGYKCRYYDEIKDINIKELEE